MTAARVVVLRHGRTGHNLQHIWQGQLDVPLDEVGVRQSQVVAEAVATFEPAAVVASDLVRASATAQAVADVHGLPLRLDERLREVDVGRWQGLTRHEITAAGDGELLAAWRQGEDVALGGAERPSQLGRRGAAALLEHAAALDDGTLVVVAHGAVLRAAVLTVLGLEQPRWALLAGLPNAGWGVVQPGERTWRLLAWGLTVLDKEPRA